jgi:hypothetical protein
MQKRKDLPFLPAVFPVPKAKNIVTAFLPALRHTAEGGAIGPAWGNVDKGAESLWQKI